MEFESKKRKKQDNYLIIKNKNNEEHESSNNEFYCWKIFFNNNDLPIIRFPNQFCVPDHLLKEMNYYFSNKSMKNYVDPQFQHISKAYYILALQRSYWTVEKLREMIHTILSKSNFNLSLINWFCIHYCSEYNISITKENGENIIISKSYKEHIDAFIRHYFDVYCRSRRILIEFVDNDLNETYGITQSDDYDLFCKNNIKNESNDCSSSSMTIIPSIHWDKNNRIGQRFIGNNRMIYFISSIGQFNFFKWALSCGIINYCKENVTSIFKNMRTKKKDIKHCSVMKKLKSKFYIQNGSFEITPSYHNHNFFKNDDYDSDSSDDNNQSDISEDDN